MTPLCRVHGATMVHGAWSHEIDRSADVNCAAPTPRCVLAVLLTVPRTSNEPRTRTSRGRNHRRRGDLKVLDLSEVTWSPSGPSTPDFLRSGKKRPDVGWWVRGLVGWGFHQAPLHAGLGQMIRCAPDHKARVRFVFHRAFISPVVRSHFRSEAEEAPGRLHYCQFVALGLQS